MNVILDQCRNRNGYETVVIEDDGTEDGGRQIAVFRLHEEAESVAVAMGWTIVDNQRMLATGESV